jgi:outer membrane autotransporter protein
VRQPVGMFWDRETAICGSGVLPMADIDNPALTPTGSIGWSTWTRVYGYTANGKGKVRGASSVFKARDDEDLGFVQGGVNWTFMNDDMGRAVASVFGHYGNSESEVSDSLGGRAGSLDIDSYGVAGSFSYVGAAGLYGDLVVLYSKHDIDTAASDCVNGKTDGKTLAFSGEAGWQFAMGETMSLVPQVQLVYQDSDIDTFINSRDVPITTSFRKDESLEGRFGVRFHYDETLTSIYKALRLHLRTDIVHDFKENGVARLNGIGLSYNQNGTGFEFGAGAWLIPVTGNGIKFGGEFDYRTPFKTEKGRQAFSASGMVGVN